MGGHREIAEMLAEDWTRPSVARAAVLGDLAALAQMPTAELTQRDSWLGQTPLAWAVRAGRLWAVAFLLERGVPFEAVGRPHRVNYIGAGEPYGPMPPEDDDWITPMELAVRSVDAAMVELLAQHGATLHPQSAYWNSLFARRGPGRLSPEERRPLLETLLATSPPPAPDSSCLVAAAATGDRFAVERLLEAGADPACLNGWGGSALRAALDAGNDDLIALLSRYELGFHDSLVLNRAERVAELLAEDPDLATTAAGERTPLMMAAEHGCIASVRELVKAGALPSASRERADVLVAAAKSGRVEMVELILELGVAPGARAQGGQTALHGAAEADAGQVVLLLVERGTPIGSYGPSGDRAEHVAAREGALGALIALVACGGNLEARNASSGSTPFFEAAAYGHLDVLSYLLDQGCDPGERDWRGRTALEEAEHTWEFIDDRGWMYWEVPEEARQQVRRLLR